MTAAIGDWVGLLIADDAIAVCEPMKKFCERFLRSFGKNIRVRKITMKVTKDFTKINENLIREEIKKLADDLKGKYFYIAAGLWEIYDWDFIIKFGKVIKRKEYYVIISGAGPLERYIKEKIKKENVENVIMTGTVNIEEVKYLTKNSFGVIAFGRPEILVLTTKENTVKVQEVIAFNKPVFTNWLENKEKKYIKLKK